MGRTWLEEEYVSYRISVFRVTERNSFIFLDTSSYHEMEKELLQILVQLNCNLETN